jgi:hypothetical protein
MADRPTAGQDSPLNELSAPLEAARRPAQAGEKLGLHVCPCCASELVYPTDWEPAPRKRWNVDLRCPECEWLGNGIYAQPVVDRFDEVLDAGTEQLLDDLNLLARANMEEQVERFVAALRANQILPEDF